MKYISCHQGKRVIPKKINKKKIVIVAIVVIMVLTIIVYLVYKSMYNAEEEVIDTTTNVETDSSSDDDVEENIIEEESQILDVDIPETMGDYKVLGQLVIEKIGVRKNILNKTESESLKIGVTKFYGPNINEPGNFCICGHNWTNVLKRLDELEIGDDFYIITQESKEKIDYEVYDKYTCNPTDLECLEQNQDNKREVTLITCNPGGATRLICKAKEI